MTNIKLSEWQAAQKEKSFFYWLEIVDDQSYIISIHAEELQIHITCAGYKSSENVWYIVLVNFKLGGGLTACNMNIPNIFDYNCCKHYSSLYRSDQRTWPNPVFFWSNEVFQTKELGKNIISNVLWNIRYVLETWLVCFPIINWC